MFTNEQLAQAFFQFAPDAIVVVDSEGRLIRTNSRAEEMFGYKADELSGQPIEILVPDRFKDMHVAHRDGYIEHPRTRPMGAGLALTGRRKDGSEFAVDIMLSPVEIGEDRLVMAIVRDVTERQHSQRALQEANQFLDALFESAPDAIIVVDTKGRLVRANGLAERMFGYEHDALIGKPIELLVPDRYRDIHVHHRNAYTRDARTRPMGTGALLGKRKDGTEFSVDIMLSPINVGPQQLVMAIVRDVSDRKRAETALHEANEFLRGLFESAPDAIIVVDDNAELQRVNAMAERMFGYDRDELLGQKLEVLVPERFRQRHVQQRDSYISEPRTRPMGAGIDLYGRRKNGSEFPVDIMLSPLELPTGGKRIMAVIRDVTERKVIEEDLKRARDEAIEANRLKSQFVANISHEVRTPMAGIIGMAEMLLHEGGLTDSQEEAVQHIYTSSGRLLAVLNDLLDFSKLEVGAIQLDNVVFSPAAVLDDVIASVGVPAQKKGLQVIAKVGDGVPEKAFGDETKIRQTLLNLAHNAVKFTHEGKVILSIELETNTTEEATVRFSVQDSGIGISDEAKARLFEPFMQADGTHRRKYGGTGLGLSIAKRFVELMGGKIGLVSTPEQGSTFWFSVPLEVR